MAAFRRKQSGALRQLPGHFGCDDFFGDDGCLEHDVFTEDTSKSVAIAPDGRHVYMASQYAIEVFRRVP